MLARAIEAWESKSVCCRGERPGIDLLESSSAQHRANAEGLWEDAFREKFTSLGVWREEAEAHTLALSEGAESMQKLSSCIRFYATNEQIRLYSSRRNLSI